MIKSIRVQDMGGVIELTNSLRNDKNDLARLSHVIVNLGLHDKLKTGTMGRQDVDRVITCIRSADKHAATLGKPAFSWTDQEIIDRIYIC